MKLLHLDPSVLGLHSVSRQVSAAVVDRRRKATPSLEVSYRDLTLTPLAHLSGSHFAAGQGGPAEASVREDIAAGHAVLSEFLAADIVVLGAPMYNFTNSEPAHGLDRPHPGGGQDIQIWRARRRGPRRQQAYHRRDLAGRFYGAGTPAAVGEHLETYLRWVFGFIGVTNPEFISADGIQIGPGASGKSGSRCAACRGKSRHRVIAKTDDTGPRKRCWRQRRTDVMRKAAALVPGALDAHDDGNKRDQKAETRKYGD